MLTNSRYAVYELVKYCGRYVYADSHESTEYNRICSKNIDESVRSFFTKMSILLLSYSTILIGPTYVYVKYGIKTTTTNLKFPFIAEDSSLEFILNVIAQAYVCAFGILGYIGLEVVMGLIHDFAHIAPKLLEYELKKFDDMVAKNCLPKSKMDLTFMNIIKQALFADELSIRFIFSGIV